MRALVPTLILVIISLLVTTLLDMDGVMTAIGIKMPILRTMGIRNMGIRTMVVDMVEIRIGRGLIHPGSPIGILITRKMIHLFNIKISDSITRLSLPSWVGFLP